MTSDPLQGKTASGRGWPTHSKLSADSNKLHKFVRRPLDRRGGPVRVVEGPFGLVDAAEPTHGKASPVMGTGDNCIVP